MLVSQGVTLCGVKCWASVLQGPLLGSFEAWPPSSPAPQGTQAAEVGSRPGAEIPVLQATVTMPGHRRTEACQSPQPRLAMGSGQADGNPLTSIVGLGVCAAAWR